MSMTPFEEHRQENFRLGSIIKQRYKHLIHNISVKPGDILVKQGEVSDKVFFISQGYVRECDFSVGKLGRTFHLYTTGDWILQAEGVVQKSPVSESLEALTVVKGYFFYMSELEEKAEGNRLLLKLLRKLLASLMLKMNDEHRFMLLDNVEQKLKLIEARFPESKLRSMSPYIASLLDVSPYELEQIRARLVQTK